MLGGFAVTMIGFAIGGSSPTNVLALLGLLSMAKGIKRYLVHLPSIFTKKLKRLSAYPKALPIRQIARNAKTAKKQ